MNLLFNRIFFPWSTRRTHECSISHVTQVFRMLKTSIQVNGEELGLGEGCCPVFRLKTLLSGSVWWMESLNCIDVWRMGAGDPVLRLQTGIKNSSLTDSVQMLFRELASCKRRMLTIVSMFFFFICTRYDFLMWGWSG